jgi:hypothetical protein
MTFRRRSFLPSWPDLIRPSIAAPMQEEMAGSMPGHDDEESRHERRLASHARDDFAIYA